MTTIIGLALRFVLILPAIVLHEVSHGYVAYLLGDPTAKRAGRLTLNPIKHVDPFGTLLLPAILLLLTRGQAYFGYAKPVPVNPGYFKNYRMGFFLTGIAGPSANLVLALLSGLAVRALGYQTIPGAIALMFAQANLILMFFNLIPIPPLDGSRVIPLFLTDAGMRTYARVEQYGFGILMLMLWGLPALTGADPIGIYFEYTVAPLLRLFAGV